MANTNIPVSVISISTERKPIVFTPTSTLCTFGSKCNKKECTFVHQEQMTSYILHNIKLSKENKELHEQVAQLKWQLQMQSAPAPKSKKVSNSWNASPQIGWGQVAGKEDAQGWNQEATEEKNQGW